MNFNNWWLKSNSALNNRSPQEYFGEDLRDIFSVMIKQIVMESPKCLCGSVSKIHFCEKCLKEHDEYCKIPF